MTIVLPPGATALLADGPHREHRSELMLFGQFVGSWDLDATWYDNGVPVHRERGEWHFFWVLEGRAIQDVWIVPPRSERPPGGDNCYEYGTTLRFFDPTLGAWRSTWHGPMKRTVIPFVARKEGEEIVLRGSHTDGRSLRWIFSDISSNRFHWRSEVLEAAGEEWDLVQDFVVRRS